MTGFPQIQSSRILPLALLALTFFHPGRLPAQSSAEWIWHKTANGQHPDGNEQQMLWLMNRARANPTAEGTFLNNTFNSEVDRYLLALGVNRYLILDEFARIAPKPPAAFDRRLYEASYAHSMDLVRRNAQDHAGQSALVASKGFVRDASRFNVYSYASSALFAHAGLNIDWGYGPGGMQPGRGHRLAVMSEHDPLLSNVGLALVPETNPSTQTGPFIFSGAYCSADTTQPAHHDRFLTGTVWTDANNNKIYDPGEGHDNVRVQPDSGPFHAVTGMAGGWSIPVVAPGSFTLTFSGGTLPSAFSRLATVGNESVLVEGRTSPPFVANATPSPNGGGLLLTWSGGTPPWQLQQFTRASGKWENVGPPLTVNSLTVPFSGPSTFYRVTASP